MLRQRSVVEKASNGNCFRFNVQLRKKVATQGPPVENLGIRWRTTGAAAVAADAFAAMHED
jgi:hypothetical protein